MRRHRTIWMPALALLGLLVTSCGGGGNPILIAGLAAAFTADPPSATPPPRISMEAGAAAGEVFTVEIHADDFDDLYGAAFTMLYDPALATFLGCSGAGSILNAGGTTIFDCALENNTEGTLNVRASLDGLVPGVAVGTGLLVSITFQAEDETAGTPFDFEAGPSREVEICPPGGPPLPACFMALLVSWDEGTLSVTLG